MLSRFKIDTLTQELKLKWNFRRGCLSTPEQWTDCGAFLCSRGPRCLFSQHVPARASPVAYCAFVRVTKATVHTHTNTLPGKRERARRAIERRPWQRWPEAARSAPMRNAVVTGPRFFSRERSPVQSGMRSGLRQRLTLIANNDMTERKNRGNVRPVNRLWNLGDFCVPLCQLHVFQPGTDAQEGDSLVIMLQNKCIAHWIICVFCTQFYNKSRTLYIWFLACDI